MQILKEHHDPLRVVAYHLLHVKKMCYNTSVTGDEVGTAWKRAWGEQDELLVFWP